MRKRNPNEQLNSECCLSKRKEAFQKTVLSLEIKRILLNFYGIMSYIVYVSEP